MIRRFAEIKSQLPVTVVCRVCGKKRKRILSDYQTVNPWNVDKDGNIKSVDQIHKENSAKLHKMEKKILEEGIICKTCQKQSECALVSEDAEETK